MTTDFLFRKAGIKDIDEIEKIYIRIFEEQEKGVLATGWQKDVYPTAQSALAALEAGELYVAEHNGNAVASARINNEQVDIYKQIQWSTGNVPDSEVLVLHTLAVSPDIAVRGCGTAFVGFYEDLAREKKCRYLRMDTNEINTRARKLYRKLGYKEVGIVPCVFNGIKDVNLVCLEKTL